LAYRASEGTPSSTPRPGSHAQPLHQKSNIPPPRQPSRRHPAAGPYPGLSPAHAGVWDEHIPSTVYNGALVPDWGNITFSNLPVISEAGSLQIPDSLAAQLGYNPSRIWSENTPIDQVLMLGDLQDAFGLANFDLATIAQLTGLNLNGISLANFPLIAQQTLASLVDAIPQLAQRTLDQVPILKDLVNLNLQNLGPAALSRPGPAIPQPG
jgi:hypothetical protein